MTAEDAGVGVVHLFYVKNGSYGMQRGLYLPSLPSGAVAMISNM